MCPRLNSTTWGVRFGVFRPYWANWVDKWGDMGESGGDSTFGTFAPPSNPISLANISKGLPINMPKPTTFQLSGNSQTDLKLPGFLTE